MDFIKIIIPYKEILNNEQIQSLALSALLGGASVISTVDGVSTYTGIGNNTNTYELLSYGVIDYIVSLGGNALNYQSYIKVVLTNEIPNNVNVGTEENPNILSIRDFEYEDIDGTLNTHTWQSWVANSQLVIEVNGEHYISGYSHYSGFKSKDKPKKHLDGKELFLLRSLGYTILNKQQFSNLLTSTNE
tara:strand:+ start:952 stop:1518 length:567 start_codon:yes stop_codon:yes gene_type:complete